MVKYTSLSPRDIEALADKAKAKIKDPTLNVVIDGEKIIKNSHDSKVDRLVLIGNNRRKKSFKKTMKQVQAEFPLLQRLFSAFIHNSSVDKLSNFFSETIFRPNPILMGALFALLVTVFNYILIRQYNYYLSGYESIIAFAFGWLVGIIYDYLKILVTGKR